MHTKCEMILSTPKMNDLLTDPLKPTEGGVLLDSNEYAALGCDLRNLKRFGRLLNEVADIENCLVLCVAEVSITYMSVDDSDALIAWTSSLSPDVTFCLLEQQSPDRPDHPFTATMLKHFAKLGTPLRTVLTYPGCHTQVLRFQDAGFPQVEFQNLWELWSDPRFLSPSQRISLDEVEPFDEWEEFALFASHYCLVVAQTGPEPLIPEQPKSRRASIDSFASDLSTRTVSPYKGRTQWFAYKYSQNPEREGRTHHASAFPIPGEDAIGVFGGIGMQNRLSTASVYASADNNIKSPAVPPQDIGARSCHTITSLGNGQNILVGGRASPSAPMKDCWLQTGSKWERIQDLPEPRFRHRATAVVLPDNQYGVVVFGGKTSVSKVAIEVLLWDRKNGWQILKSLRSDPMPRFGASFVRLGYNHGLLFGGMRHDGVICQGLWRWRLIIRDNIVAGIRFKTSSALDTSAGVFPWLSRLGASYSVIRNELLVIGGVAKQGCIPKDYEILSILGSFSAFGEFEKEMQLRVACVHPKMDPDVPRPLLVGHSTHRTAKETTLIAGGGAVCFSFGAFWNAGCWLLYDREAGVGSHWALVPSTSKTSLIDQKESSVQIPVALKCIRQPTEQDLYKIIEESTPRLLSGLKLGPCVSLWTPSYLHSQLPADHKVVVHAAGSRIMNFQRKDFSYVTIAFHEFLRQCEANPNAHLYLRSISATKPAQSPANFTNDWPSIAPDFHLDPVLDLIQRQMHSSVLRISANVSMWLHYDVMANVLFQIRGTRKLILFPPEDIKHLSFPSGSTTSTISVLEPAHDSDHEEDRLKAIPNTHPHTVILRPGEALFIPPLWAHTATPLPTPRPNKSGTNTDASDDPATSRVNISINIFFRSLASSKYQVGRDVYGNRDLAAYEDGRRDLEKIVRRFVSKSGASHTGAANLKQNAEPTASSVVNGAHDKDTIATTASPTDSDQVILSGEIPKSIAKAYLERLADELRERAEKL
ncbi:hypothetical protein, variant 1 [Exophiala mesophila]|nr:hypothetical protein, variant 1 [Exophiala mesophila]KIV93932.1 hypothetical protein, variant 1 [Exophiala mesophila]